MFPDHFQMQNERFFFVSLNFVSSNIVYQAELLPERARSYHGHSVDSNETRGWAPVHHGGDIFFNKTCFLGGCFFFFSWLSFFFNITKNNEWTDFGPDKVIFCLHLEMVNIHLFFSLNESLPQCFFFFFFDQSN